MWAVIQVEIQDEFKWTTGNADTRHIVAEATRIICFLRTLARTTKAQQLIPGIIATYRRCGRGGRGLEGLIQDMASKIKK